MKMKLGHFSRFKVYPGHGGRYTWTDGKVFQFLDAKCELAFFSKRKPHQINWTVLFRSKHRKGRSEEIQKKRTCRALKFQRAETGASLADVMAKQAFKGQQWLLQRLPRRQHLSRRQGSL
uniref:Large ribosomal subunit protein eL24-related N-terminal domain-containing protein n=1 Tax=Moschus moschiferus TaxID=68415 RepID=A0A8C6FEF6_MOSMO